MVDSGAGMHITPNRSFIRNMRALGEPIPLSGVFGHPQVATHFGEGEIPLSPTFTLRVPGLIFMPTIKDTLLSYVRLIREGHSIAFDGGTGVFVDADKSIRLPLSGAGNIISFAGAENDPDWAFSVNAVTRSAAANKTAAPPGAPASSKGRAKPVTGQSVPGIAASAQEPLTDVAQEVRIAHARYGHLCSRKLVQLAQSGTVQLDSSSLVRLGRGNKKKLHLCERTCDACELGKMARLQFAQQIDHAADAPNDKVVADVCGPVHSQTNADGTRTKYSMSLIVDVYSRHLEMLIIESKDQASEHCISYMHRAKVLTGRDMKHFHTDGGTEYHKFERAATMRGTKVTRTPVHTPQRNAIAERKNRTLIDMARALMGHAQLPVGKFWRAALETAVFVHNRCTIVAPHGKTMHELFTGRAPDLSHLRVFGCDAFVRVVDPQAKLAPRSEKGIFIGYDMKREHCYRILVGDAVVVSRDVTFVEDRFTVGRAEVPQRDHRDGPGSNRASAIDPARRAEMEKSRAAQLRASLMEFGGAAVSSLDGASELPTSDDLASSPSTQESAAVAATAAIAAARTQVPRIPVSAQRGGRTPLTDGAHRSHGLIDATTRKRLAAAMERENARATAPAANQQRPKRARQQARQTGVNLDDFGRVALAVTVSPSHVTPQSRLQHVPLASAQAVEPQASTAEHSPDTIPKDKIRVADVEIPSTAKKAMSSPFASFWRAAMAAEHASLVQHATYELVPLPHPRPNLVSCRWVFAVKEKDGLVTRFKARLVARGFTQQEGIDFTETYSPVVKYKSLRIFLALVVRHNWRVEIMDVQTAYLHADLKETVYMQQPEGFERHDTQRENGADVHRPLVCLLRKALYGLKQAGREWNAHLDAFLRSLGFTRCKSDTCLYVRMSRSGIPIILAVYVDDIPSSHAPEDESEWGEIKAAFLARFKIAFQANADWLLNMRLTRDASGRRLVLDQQAYIEQILEDFGMDEVKAASHPGTLDALEATPADGSLVALTPAQQRELQSFPYRRAIGLLMYLANTSRPDITHAVSVASRYVERPGLAHVQAVKQILRYLSGTREHGLLFQWNGDAAYTAPLLLAGYADADWGGCKDSARSTTGFLITINGSIVDWGSQRQKTVALSSCEAEFMAISAVVQSVMWFQTLLGEIGFTQFVAPEDDAAPPTRSPDAATSLAVRTPTLFNDNRSAIAMSHNDVHHQRSKHISLRYHFVREAIAARVVRLEWCSTHEQLADVLTKALPPTPFTRLRDVLVHTRKTALDLQ